jgi:uncharacterized protein (DUF1800 family)
VSPAWNYENAAHLLRRAAFGGSPTEIAEFLGRHPSVQSAVNELLSFAPSKEKPPSPRANDEPGLRKIQAWWLREMITATKPNKACMEKLVLFWHGHLVSGAGKQPDLGFMSVQNGLFRFNARGNFKTLIREFTRDPANLYYLDGIINAASTDGLHVSANENYSRELLELFIYGRFEVNADGAPDPSKPNYTESDVHQLARVCSGFTSISNGVGVWNPSDWDGGQYDDNGDDLPDDVTLFGVTNNDFRIDPGVAGTADDVLGLLFDQVDSTGQNRIGVFLARKLWSFYAYAPPAPGLKATVLDPLATAFATSGFDLTALLRAMWTHDEFYSTHAKTRTVKNPVDYVVQAMRAFGLAGNGEDVVTLPRPLGEQLTLMNMTLFEPPSVGGWSPGLAWMNIGTLLARAEFAKDMASGGGGNKKLDLKKVPGLIGSATADPAATVDRILAQVGLNAAQIGTIPPSRPLALTSQQRAALIAYATNNGAKATLDLSKPTTNDANVKARGLIALTLQTAENQIL